jgi:glutathione S-transferase
MSTDAYRLIYFPLKGRGEVSRILFLLAGQAFEDVRIDFGDWPKIKGEMPMRQLPVLQITRAVDGKMIELAQSNCIERFLATRFGLMGGSDDIQHARIDMINEHVVDMRSMLHAIYSSIKYKKANEAEKRKELDEALSETIPNGYKLIERLYVENQREYPRSGFLVGDRVSYADVKFVVFHDWLRDRRDEVLDKVPLLREHFVKIRNLPGLREHFLANEKTPVTLLF